MGHQKTIPTSKKGFTLTEVVLVLTVISLLAVAALPVIIDLVGRARQGQAYAMMAKFQSVVHLARLSWELEGYPSHVRFENVLVGVSPTNGYPECIGNPGTGGWCATGATDSRSGDFECAEIWNSLLPGAPPAAATASCTGTCRYGVTHVWAAQEYCVFTDQQGVGTNQIYYYYLTGRVSMGP